MTGCQTLAQIQYLVPIELNPSSHCPGNIEAACKLANNLITETTCPDTNENVMAVAIVDGDFHLNEPFRYLVSDARKNVEISFLFQNNELIKTL